MSDKYKTITSYVSKKVWPDGNETFSFKLNDYVKKQLADLPPCYISINKKKDPSDEEIKEGNLYYMSAKLPQGEAPQPQPQTMTF